MVAHPAQSAMWVEGSGGGRGVDIGISLGEADRSERRGVAGKQGARAAVAGQRAASITRSAGSSGSSSSSGSAGSAAAAGRSAAEVLNIDGREVRITNPHKVYFPAAGITKLQLVHYYLAVAEGALIRAIGGRPLVLKRYVNGIAGEGFFQKRAPGAIVTPIFWADTIPSRTRKRAALAPADGVVCSAVAAQTCRNLGRHRLRGLVPGQ